MRPHLTIVYITGRLEPKIEWFLETFNQQAQSFMGNIKLVAVDFYADQEGRRAWLLNHLAKTTGTSFDWVHAAPKPTVWQGPHRLTKEDYFAIANTRNTGLCLAPDGWIAYVDDLTVLMPGWLPAIWRAMDQGFIACGAYKKVLDLKLENGTPSFTPFAPGVDSRWGYGSDDHPIQAGGSWLYGCSSVMPVEALLAVNGWDEDVDLCGMGGEDYVCGIMMARAGYIFRYDRSMLTLESEELHHVGPTLKRTIEKVRGREDASRVLLKMVLEGRNIAPNYFPPGGIKAERERVLKGEPFTVIRCPEHSWYSGILLKDL